MSTKAAIILVLSAILLLSLFCNYYQYRVQVVTEKHYAQGRKLDSLQLKVYEDATATLTAKCDVLQQEYLATKNRYLAVKLTRTNTDGLSDKQLSDILKQKLAPMGGP